MKHKSTPYALQLWGDLKKMLHEIVVIIAFAILFIIDARTMKEEYRMECPRRDKSMYKWFKSIPDEN